MRNLKRIIPILASVILLSGCVGTIETREGDVPVRVNLVDSKVEADAWCSVMHRQQAKMLEQQVTTGPPLVGCAVMTDGVCRIVAVKPDGWGDHKRMKTVGHELLHCIGWKHL